MATLAPSNVAMRQPFGVLDGSKIRNLQSMKNRQNAIPLGTSPSLKRRAVSPETSDSENVDPNLQALMGKRKRSTFDEDVSASKPSRYSLNSIPTSKIDVDTPMTKPSLDLLQVPSRTPASAPVGRSPTKTKRPGLLEPRQRFAPPAFGIKAPSLSITAALNGTLANRKSRKIRTLEESKPKSWFFDIFEETEEVQDYRMNEWTMTQSATSLDISDDESKTKERSDRGKENIDPNEISIPVTRSMAAAAAAKAVSKVPKDDKMLDEPRTPLGDLNPVEYYGEGLDATSVILVHDDVAVETAVQNEDGDHHNSVPVQDFSYSDVSQLDAHQSITPVDIGAIIADATPAWQESIVEDAEVKAEDDILAPCGDLDIWESESAKDETEKQDGIVNEGVFALQEL